MSGVIPLFNIGNATSGEPTYKVSSLPFTYTVIEVVGSIAALAVFIHELATKREREEIGLLMVFIGSLGLFVAFGDLSTYWEIAVLSGMVTFFGLLLFVSARRRKAREIERKMASDADEERYGKAESEVIR